MAQNYLVIRDRYLSEAWEKSIDELEKNIPARIEDERLIFEAFGERCILSRTEITLSGEAAQGAEGLLIAMYASRAPALPVQIHPLKSFKELPNSMPYQAAFSANSELLLVPHVEAIHQRREGMIARFSGHVNTDAISGDFSFTLYPLPRIPLYYIFHLPDEEFPAGVSCLFAANAIEFMPLDGLADVAEYTARRIIALLP